MECEVFYTFIGLTVLMAVLAAYGPADARAGYAYGAIFSGILAFIWAVS